MIFHKVKIFIGKLDYKRFNEIVCAIFVWICLPLLRNSSLCAIIKCDFQIFIGRKLLIGIWTLSCEHKQLIPNDYFLLIFFSLSLSHSLLYVNMLFCNVQWLKIFHKFSNWIAEWILVFTVIHGGTLRECTKRFSDMATIFQSNRYHHV